MLHNAFSSRYFKRLILFFWVGEEGNRPMTHGECSLKEALILTVTNILETHPYLPKKK